MKSKASGINPIQAAAYSGVARNGNGSREQRSDWETQISSRAFDLYEKRGREDGHDLEDWLEAERQIENEVERQHV